MRKGRVAILTQTEHGVHMNASCGRISTTQGGAIEIFAKNTADEADRKLIHKVALSGHMAALEHHTMTLAFDGASVFVEQFMIEHRLASYMVKSRRYVDFSGAGFVVPDGAGEDWRAHMESFFADYARLLELGIPKEDARFVLPYAFRGHFYMTANVRTLLRLAAEMTRGRGAVYPEISYLGDMLKEQLDALYPGLVERERVETALPAAIEEFAVPHEAQGSAALLQAPAHPLETLRLAGRFAGRDLAVRDLVRDARPRELETLSYLFSFSDLSLAGLTHLARHRMLSLLVQGSAQAVARGAYIVPTSVRENAEALERYCAAFARASAYAAAHKEWAHYCALAGNTVDALVAMNAREILHFMELRACNRAQWEIRGLAHQLLRQLREHAPELFGQYGPACRVRGACPEGRLSCGAPYKPQIGLTANRNKEGEQFFPQEYIQAIESAGGEVRRIPFDASPAVLRALVNELDGVLFSGGPDIAPWRFGEAQVHPKTVIDAQRDEMEMNLFEMAFAAKLPMLGICRGHQVINVALGGTLCQHIPDAHGVSHYDVMHEVRFAPDSRLAAILQADVLTVNSFHHQSVENVAPPLRAAAMCGEINEAVEWAGEDRWIFGVEWHPERFPEDEHAQRLFAAFVRAARRG